MAELTQERQQRDPISIGGDSCIVCSPSRNSPSQACETLFERTSRTCGVPRLNLGNPFQKESAITLGPHEETAPSRSGPASIGLPAARETGAEFLGSRPLGMSLYMHMNKDPGFSDALNLTKGGPVLPQKVYAVLPCRFLESNSPSKNG